MSSPKANYSLLPSEEIADTTADQDNEDKRKGGEILSSSSSAISSNDPPAEASSPSTYGSTGDSSAYISLGTGANSKKENKNNKNNYNANKSSSSNNSSSSSSSSNSSRVEGGSLTSFLANVIPFQLSSLNSSSFGDDNGELKNSKKMGEYRPLLLSSRRPRQQSWWTRHGTVMTYIIAAVVILCVVMYHFLFQDGSGCLGAPYLYLSHHGGKNVMKISRDGCLVKDKVLWGNFKNSDLRGMALGLYNGKESLYVLDSHSHSSQLLVFSDCSYFSGMRSFIRTALDFKLYPGLSHPYSVSLTKRGLDAEEGQENEERQSIRASRDHNKKKFADSFYVSSQHTDLVQHFTPDEFMPKKLPSAFYPAYVAVNNINVSAIDPHHFRFYNGTFMQFGYPDIHKESEQGVRGVLAVDDEVWIANEDLHRVFIFNAISGQLLSTIAIANPIGLYVNEADINSVFIGYRSYDSKHDKKNTTTYKKTHYDDPYLKETEANGGVVIIDRATRARKMKFSLLSMKHPTGMASYEDTLFVADQSTQSLYSFNISNGQFLNRIASSEDILKGIGELEHLIFSNC